ncbi:MAG: FAD-binding oxidoreductase [Sandaracinaceae bacterium]|nr:FAD-binding oxidoreductase [Sandaracinaceae bacterium]
MTVSLWQDRSSEVTHRTDFVVIGAGISGASAAYWLASRGEKVALVDAGPVAAGASGKSAGMLLLGTADPYSRVVDLYGRDRARDVWSFTAECRALLTEHVFGAGENDADLRLVRTGTVSAAVSEHELSEIRRSGELLVADGFAHEDLDAATLKAAFHGDAFLGGLRDPAGMTVDPARLTRRVVGLAKDRGAEVFENHELFRIEEHEDGVVALTSRGRFEAEMILLCTNAYSPLVHPHLEGKVYPARGQMLATEPLPERVIPWGIYCDFGYEYFWQLDSGEVVAGGWRQHSADAEKGYSDETTPGIQEGVWEFMQRAVPALQGKRVTHRWAGVMGFSGDGLPFIGDLPSKPRVKYLAGHTGHGFGFGFLAAKKLVDLALEGDPIGWLGAGRLTLQGA